MNRTDEPTTASRPPRGAQRTVDWLIRWRTPLLVTGLVVGVLSWLPAGQLSFDRSIENMFAPDDPVLAPYRRLKRTFGGNEIVLAVYTDSELMSAAGFARLEENAGRIEKVAGVDSVLGLHSTPLGSTIFTSDNPLLKQLSRPILDLLEG